MTTRRAPQALNTGGLLWGPKRVRLGISIRELARVSGVNRGLISLMETGRMVPTGLEYDHIQAAIDAIVVGRERG